MQDTFVLSMFTKNHNKFSKICLICCTRKKELLYYFITEIISFCEGIIGRNEVTE